MKTIINFFFLILSIATFGQNSDLKGRVISLEDSTNFIYPDPCKDAPKICPYGHTDHIIPIVYGLPGKRLLRKARKGQIKLGGCIISDCDPKWYCKEHKIDF